MKLNKKVIGLLLGITGMVAVTAVTTNGKTAESTDLVVREAANTGLEEKVVAGFTATLNEYQKSAAALAVAKVSVESEAIELVSATADGEVQTEENSSEDYNIGLVPEVDVHMPEAQAEEEVQVEETAQVEPELTKEEQEWQEYLMADVEQSLNVRKKPNENSEIVGKLYKGDRAKIVKEKGDWIKIESGKVKGFVKESYCVTGTKALKYAKKNCDKIATVNTDGLRLRSKQSTEAKVITAVASGTELKVKNKAKTKDGWVAVVYGGDTCYVSEDYVDVELKTGKAVTIQEEIAAREAEEAAQKAAAEAEAAKKAQATQSNGAATTQKAAYSASVDDVTLLAAIIQCEAGGCSYEGKVAVGAVVMNRVRSGSFPNSISGVIYQSGQFSPARTGLLAARLRSGVSASCRQAAQAALGGQDNTNGAKYFKYASSGQRGVVYGKVVFY